MNDPRTLIDDARMTGRQMLAVAIMVALNAIDGFDVLSSAFAAPGIAREWGIGRDALGIVLAMELVGMGIGSIVLGGAADRFGRKVTILGCLLVMTGGMWLATTASSPTMLGLWRLLTGLGIGGMLAAINAVTAELSSRRGRAIAMALMVIGYPLGATIGGTVAGMLLQSGDWRVVFEFGALATAAFIPLVWLLVPETPDYFLARRPPDALARINHALGALRLPQIAALPAPLPHERQPGLLDILRPGLLRTTVLLTIGNAFHALTFYYVLKWSPKIVADFGYSAAEAASVLVWANIGGATGGALFGLLVQRLGIRWPTIAMLLMGTGAVLAFGLGADTLSGWKLAVFLTGFTTNAAIVGFYSALAAAYPAHARATGTGFVIGIGRVGGAGSPILAGLLFQQGGLGLMAVSAIMAMGSIVAAIALALLPMRRD